MLKHIQLKKPDIIVALGGVSAKALLDTDLGILKLRGRFQEKQFGLEQPIRILPTLHPAYLLRAPAQKKLAFQDLVLLKRAITNGMVKY
jgi:DNA polymerase